MEKWREYYTDDTIKKVQRVELELLIEFIRICDVLGLEYVIYGGTLLGAIKYRGFIPWDDDVDVALPRKSYNKFIKLANKVTNKDFFVQSPYNCANSPYPYTKFRKRGTRFVEYHNRNLKIEDGVYIDVYPIDRIPDNEKLRRKQYKKVQKWINIYVCRQSRLYDKKENSLWGKAKNVMRFFECKIPKVFPQKYCINKIDYYMTMYNNCETKRYAALNSPNYENIYVRLYPLKKGLFEGNVVYLPGGYKNHLHRRYGDYNVLPKEEDRYGHIPYILEC